MKIFVSTCDKYRHLLPGFAWCFNKYWPSNQEVTVLGYSHPPDLPSNFEFHCLNAVEDKPFTAYIHTYLQQAPAECFLFLLDDHWLIRTINTSDVAALECEVCAGAAKAHLSSDPLRLDWRPFRNGLLRAAYHGAKTSLQPAIWRRDYMLRLMDPRGITPWQVEGLRSVCADTAAVVGFPREVYVKPGIDGVYKHGTPSAEGLGMLSVTDTQALRDLGYTQIEKGLLTYENTGIDM